MRKFKCLVLFVMILSITACTKNTEMQEIYDDIGSAEAVKTDSLDRAGIKDDEVKDDARFYFEPENDKSKWVGINMSFEDVQSILKEEEINLGERTYQYAGEVMKGWWFDGISSLQGQGIILSFDKAGNLFEFVISDKYRTSRGIGIGAKKEEVLLAYGNPEYTVNYSGDIEIMNFSMDRYAVRFLIENDAVKEIKVTETVMQFVLQEFAQ